MIKKYAIRNFKPYLSLDTELVGANIIIGLNSSGKSSLIQPLLLVAQSGLVGALAMGRVALNGPFVSIGTGQDLMHEFAEDEVTSVLWNESTVSIPYQADASELAVNTSGLVDVSKPLGSVTYISNARVAPQMLYGRYNDFEVVSPIAGVQGESAPGYLANRGNAVTSSGHAKRHHDHEGTLLEQVNYWMGEISPSVSLNIDEFYQFSNLALRFTFDGQATVRTRPYSAGNVGFGLSHSLSIVTALLAAPEGSLLVIEGPEANLHPRAQKRLGELIGRATGDGVQVIVETHSPYLVRGVRASVGANHLPSKDLKVFYAQRVDAQSLLTEVGVDENGNFDEDTFDPIEDDYVRDFQAN